MSKKEKEKAEREAQANKRKEGMRLILEEKRPKK